MKTVLVLCVLLCAAFAAPAEDKEKAPGQSDEAINFSEMEDKMMMMKVEEASVPQDSGSAPRNAPVLEEAAPQSRFNFCPADWFSHSSRCYKFVNSPLSWYKAEEHCNSLGAHLASVTNPREYTFLQQITQTAGQSIAWLGGFNLQGQWMWIDREGFYYTNWQTLSSTTSYPCIYLSSTTGWRNIQCGTALRFICSTNPFSC
ncbi:ladderlectin-like [Chelmon rostratus]|uniref:ladderlectin-like n=1 Tax=Chelmon rostratus TaxID=109905 RepID=UPI001BE550C4|nr:ladderlectin-like [Chelmon rostratus]